MNKLKQLTYWNSFLLRKPDRKTQGAGCLHRTSGVSASCISEKCNRNNAKEKEAHFRVHSAARRSASAWFL
jgi:hypothetical protein